LPAQAISRAEPEKTAKIAAVGLTTGYRSPTTGISTLRVKQNSLSALAALDRIPLAMYRRGCLTARESALLQGFGRKLAGQKQS